VRRWRRASAEGMSNEYSTYTAHETVCMDDNNTFASTSSDKDNNNCPTTHIRHDVQGEPKPPRRIWREVGVCARKGMNSCEVGVCPKVFRYRAARFRCRYKRYRRVRSLFRTARSAATSASVKVIRVLCYSIILISFRFGQSFSLKSNCCDYE
jgi:hypothetical protein